MENCIFCKIIRGEIPSAKVYEDEDLIVIKDIVKGVFNEIQRMVGRMVCELHRAFV